MRVLLIVNRSQRRGAEMFGLDLRNELERTGHSARLVALYGRLRSEDSEGFVDEVIGGRPDHPLERLPGFHPALLRRLSLETRRFHPDIVQVHGSRPVKYGSLLRRADRHASWRLVYRNIGDPRVWLGPGLRRELYRAIVLSQMDGIVAVSEATRKNLLEIVGPSVPMVQIPRGIDFDRLRPRRSRENVRESLETPSDRPVALYVGSLSREKRPDRFLRVLARACSGGLRAEAWIVGDGPLRAELEASAREMGEDLHVRFLGVQPNIGDYLGAADLLLLTSDTEGMPGILLEAGAAGLASVATGVGGVKECLIDGQTGLISDATDEVGLARAVRHLLEHGDTRLALGQRARNLIATRFSIDKVCLQYVDFYRHLLAAPLESDSRSSSSES